MVFDVYQIPYIISTNEFKVKSMVVLSSIMHRSPNYLLIMCTNKIGFRLRGPNRGSKSKYIEFLRI